MTSKIKQRRVVDDQRFRAWFDLGIYQDTNEISYWENMVSIRMALSSGTSGYTKDQCLEKFERLIAYTARLADPITYKKYIDRTRSFEVPIPESQASATLMTIEDLRELAFFHHIDKLEPFCLDFSEFIWNSNHSKEFLTPLCDRDKHRDTELKPGYTPMMINLNKPVEQIVRDLKKIIKQRNRIPTSTKSRARLHRDLRKEVEKWGLYGLLPYFDIKFYCELTDQIVSKRELGELIWPINLFPDIGDPEDRIKQYTEPFFDKVFTPETLAAIRFG